MSRDARYSEESAVISKEKNGKVSRRSYALTLTNTA